VNRGSLFISLKPLSERGGLSAQAVANRLRQKTADIPGLRLYLFPMQVRVGGRLVADSAHRACFFGRECLRQLFRDHGVLGHAFSFCNRTLTCHAQVFMGQREDVDGRVRPVTGLH
jgi:hypothetical protein